MTAGRYGKLTRRVAGHRGLAAGAALAAASLSLAACSSSSSSSTPTKPVATPAAVTGSLSARLTEYHIALSKSTVHAGTYRIDVRNSGGTVHSLAVTGPGVNARALQSYLQPGQHGTLEVTLRDGTYDVYCPVPGHKDLGMDTTLTVTG